MPTLNEGTWPARMPFPLFLKKQLAFPLENCHSCIPAGAIWVVNHEAFFTLIRAARLNSSSQ